MMANYAGNRIQALRGSASVLIPIAQGDHYDWYVDVYRDGRLVEHHRFNDAAGARDKLESSTALGPEEMEAELARLKACMDLSGVNSVVFLRSYIELLDHAYLQQAVSLHMATSTNQTLWESNDRITRELQDQIAELEKTAAAERGEK